MKNLKVAIIIGSDSDLPVLSGLAEILEDFGVNFSINVASAHRTPSKVKDIIKKSERNGAEVFIAVAGMAAALPGVVAAETILPVIGVPVKGKSLSGMDALLSIVQMPPGIPVATVAIGNQGAMNAGILAVQIIAGKDASLKKKLISYRKKLASSVEAKDKNLQKIGLKNYIDNLKNK